MLVLYRLLVPVILARASFAQTDSCREGFYGDNCELICSETCRPFQTYPCDKNTGQCSEGCQGGYYGDQCEERCSCASGVCYQQNGECLEISATTDRTTQNTTTIRNGSPETNVSYQAKTEEHVCVCDGEQDVWLVVGIIFIVLTVILFLILIGMVLFKTVRRRMKRSPATGTRNRRFINLPCCTGIGGEDNKTNGQNVPLTEVHTTPVPESGAAHVEQAAEAKEEDELAQGQASSEDQSSDPLVAKHNEEKEEMSQRIKKLEEEKHQIEEQCRNEKRQLEEKYKAEHNKTLTDLGLPTNTTIHLIETSQLNPSHFLQCPHLKFDKETVNVKVAHVDESMLLINSPIPDKNNSRGFKNFRGTTCTSPLEKTGFYQYFEAVFYMLLKKKFGEGEVVTQIGFCEGKDKDANKLTAGKKSCCVVKAVGCKKHNGICLAFTQGGKSECIQQLNNNTVDSSTKINIGIRLNKENNRIGVYDFGERKELLKSNINIGDRIWPMFGVCEQDRATVRVELKSGRSIDMSKKKDIMKPK